MSCHNSFLPVQVVAVFRNISFLLVALIVCLPGSIRHFHCFGLFDFYFQ